MRAPFVKNAKKIGSPELYQRFSILTFNDISGVTSQFKPDNIDDDKLRYVCETDLLR